jgi:hypothetical protein
MMGRAAEAHDARYAVDNLYFADAGRINGRWLPEIGKTAPLN